MFTQSSSETKTRIITGELLDWTIPGCDLMSEAQFITAQEACSQAWKALQDYMHQCPTSLFTELYADRATNMLSDAILEACACQPNAFDKRLSVDQLCDAALNRMGFIIMRDEFGVGITGDRIAFPGRET